MMSHHVVDTSPATSSNGRYPHDNEKEINNITLTESDGTVQSGTRLHRDLKARQVAMIAIGGAIGTGIIPLPSAFHDCA